PWAVAAISNLPTMRNKRAAVFCTFGLNPGKSLNRLTGAVEATGANVLGGLALNRFHLEEHSEVLITRLVDAYDALPAQPAAAGRARLVRRRLVVCRRRPM